MIVEIDKGSGFCFGVVNAINHAEKELVNTDVLYCLGDIVHNSLEVERLEAMGLRTIDHDDFTRLKDVKVLLRAHGEPLPPIKLPKRTTFRLWMPPVPSSYNCKSGFIVAIKRRKTATPNW